MIGENELGAHLDGLGKHGFREIHGEQDAADHAVARRLDEQPHVVPVFRQGEGGKGLEELQDIGERTRHGPRSLLWLDCLRRARNNTRIFARIGIAFGAFFRLLFDASYAAEVTRLEDGDHAAGALGPATKPEVPREERIESDREATSTKQKPARDLGPALQLLELLQREGRFVDFIQQDIVGFSDNDVGAAARIVHQGCRRALLGIAQIAPIRTEAEGNAITLEPGFDAKTHRLVGNVQGQPPYRGTLKHRGWRVADLTLEEPLPNATLDVIAQAEVEL
ncbi:MAG: DUF2760 domain-containing protein [Polyangiaceae bacterium]